ncbi:putative fatty acyl-AMP ligase and polyketide synthase [Mycobacterium ulcerans str. Harvey]|uniref:Fatty acyl-AMP ligase and polyketide synthase n=1 Tax=Mycobacterium ulcerans str. Harvey TaxID=1299332 RepID=A0ABN0R9Z4_MYCUL|nr:putative fatty acyl-AMP ligase and polyketide synthase [Mycobacterium ulcerans str. Harvey]
MSDGADEPIVTPSVTAFCDLETWDSCALDLSGSSGSLFVSFATRLAQLMGRVRVTDGAVTIIMPVSERTNDDTRANAVTAITFDLDPDRARTDLQFIRNETNKACPR